ncbi:hypothetical protein PCNPT3_09610 [Psychromonas sp. CNPT3]|uniref:DUF3461 family protein n=1 Tax=Psychromonas sp. CNPT3 TaxID=314282 RepID=UPI00006E913A|nr:DUF3461 family protein [Psychromonas sp. CNPT3]AGH81860.1 hypothetical protein PCNPT3_09610 [Psychromonas sp. CNPT3]
MFPHLATISITNTHEIKRYSLRHEGVYDILKIYFKKERGSHQIFSRSVKFKFPRQNKKINSDTQPNSFENISEINASLRNIIEELDTLTLQVKTKTDIKSELLEDIKHLETVFNAKINEIEEKIKNL